MRRLQSLTHNSFAKDFMWWHYRIVHSVCCCSKNVERINLAYCLELFCKRAQGPIILHTEPQLLNHSMAFHEWMRILCALESVILAIYVTTLRFLFVQHWSDRTQFCYGIVNHCFTWHCTIRILPMKLSMAFPPWRMLYKCIGSE